MAHWNHRVVHQTIKSGESEEEWYDIHEVHYDQNDTAEMITKKGISAGGNSIEELKKELQRMLDCLDKPILEFDDF